MTEAIFAAWQEGERTGNYGTFRAYLGPLFLHFSHPLLGRFTGEEARTQLEALIAERETKPNALVFSSIVVSTNAEGSVFQFE
jgi:hypothetical protein